MKKETDLTGVPIIKNELPASFRNWFVFWKAIESKLDKSQIRSQGLIVRHYDLDLGKEKPEVVFEINLTFLKAKVFDELRLFIPEHDKLAYLASIAGAFDGDNKTVRQILELSFRTQYNDK